MTPSLMMSLYAMRVQLDAVILAAESESGIAAPPAEAGSCPECGAPEEKVENISTLDGTKKFHCSVCQHYWEPVI